MKVGLLLPNNVYFCPYVKIYTKILEKNGIPYDILYWDREGIEETAAYRYSRPSPYTATLLKKFFNWYLYVRFLKKVLKKENYDRLIIFSPQLAIFLYDYLKKYYCQKFILDYRDLSIEQRLKNRFEKVLKISKMNAISSPGFKSCLPTDYPYILSHNFDIDLLEQTMSKKTLPNKIKKIDGKYIVLTIGGIRDYEQNEAIIKAFANNPDYQIHFIGKGVASKLLEEYAKDNQIKNVYFEGFYRKECERKYIQNSTLMNIYYPRKLSHNTALSNRFYNSLMFCKPMITTANTVQGDYVAQFRVGVAITSDNIVEEIQQYIDNFNPTEYQEGRNKLLEKFYKDYEVFEQSLLKALND